jgi:hypothetical protein
MRGNTPEKLAWQSVLASIGLVYVGTPVNFVLGRTYPEMPHWPEYALLGLATVLLVCALRLRHTRGLGTASLVFLVNNFAVVIVLWYSNAFFSSVSRSWVPFQPNKLSVLTSALLAPTTPVGLVTIGLFGGSALIQYATFDASVRARFPFGEPAAMIAFTLFALAVLWYRTRQRRLEREIIRSQSESALLGQVARRFLALRDLANTPLQTIEVSASLIREIPAARVHGERIQRSLERLQEWQRILGEDAAHVPWTDADVGFDALALLKEPRPSARGS